MSESTDIVSAVYAALRSTDPLTIKAAAAKYFDDEIVVREAESLPWGGVYRGREQVTRLMANIGDPQSPIDAANLNVDCLFAAVDPITDTDHVVAAISFPWRSPRPLAVPMRALEWFSVRKGRVVEIQIYLWDTAAGIAALQPAEVSEGRPV